MYIIKHHRRPTARPGAILLIVLVMLALFAVIGLSFVLYAESEAVNARIHREAMNEPDPKVIDGTPFVSAFLGQVIYPVGDRSNDPGPNVLSALRGHELARLMYGYNANGSNLTPYSGVGSFVDPSTQPLPLTDITDRRMVINYSLIDNQYLVDPEHTYYRNNSQISKTPGPLTNQTYIGKNAPYTYPDRNNALLGMIDPSNGQVVQPSLHRPDLFGTQPSSPGINTWKGTNSLNPTNPNWVSVNGKYMLVRPRPFDHQLAGTSEFPYPPMNPDGSYTGDVQNYRWGNGVQRNDSVWVDAGLPATTFRGRKVQPLVAALVVALDGRLNVNVVGSNLQNAQHSHHGFGPYEINLAKILAQSGVTEIVNFRNNGPNTPVVRGTNVNTAYMDETNAPLNTYQEYAKTNWDATIANPITMPLQNQYHTEAVYPGPVSPQPGPYTNNTSVSNNTTNNMPWKNHPSLFNPYMYDETVPASRVGRVIPNRDLRLSANRYSMKPLSPSGQPVLGLANGNLFTGSGPNNVENAARAKLTTISNSVSRPAMMPNFGTYNPAGASLTNGKFAMAPTAFTTTGSPTGEFAMGDLRSLQATFGAVNLNRPLADYRVDPTKPLRDPVNVAGMAGKINQATADRQNFAKDIFERLCLATGASAIPLAGAATGAQRYLAQLAVNIVDFIDSDDISTPFVWNPANPNDIVYGVEKQRVVINKAYGEVTNDNLDTPGGAGAQRPFQVRFFVELLNPLDTASAAGTPPPLGDGSADLVIPTGNIPVYQLLVYDNGAQVQQSLYGAAATTNTKGDINGPQARITMDFTKATSTGQPTTTIEPNNGQAASTGFRLVSSFPATNAPSPPNSDDYKPNSATREVLVVGDKNQPTGFYYTDAGTPVPASEVGRYTTGLNQNGQGKHAVVLRRLANPYMAFNPNPGPGSNPYITVDAMNYVQVWDAVQVGRRERGNPEGKRSTDTPTDQGRRHPLERKAPLYARQGASAADTSTFSIAATAPPSQVFLKHDQPSLLPSFDWLAHFDRKLINAAELLVVPACKPHELTHHYAVPQPGGGAPAYDKRQQHLAPWTDATSNLYRAMEMLTVKPYIYGVPLGGRVPGKVNANMIWSKDVLSAVLDPAGGNGFTQGDVDSIWNSIFAANNTGARSRKFPAIGSTSDEVGPTDPNGDVPFKALGTATYGAGGMLPAGSGIENTLLRSNGTGQPLFFANALAANNNMHPYIVSEGLRKGLNNLTTTSDTYLVLMTVGYFEIRGTQTIMGITKPILGKEVFREVPGDLRSQYSAVVDRTALALDATGRQAATMFMTETVDNATLVTTGPSTLKVRCNIGSGVPVINYEGLTYTIQNGDTLYVGTGSSPVKVVVAGSSVNNGVATLSVNATAAGSIPAGTAVSNVILGNPGPQPGFDPTLDPYKLVVRDFGKVPPP